MAAAVDLEKLSLDDCHGCGELQLLGFIDMPIGSIPFLFSKVPELIIVSNLVLRETNQS